MRLTAIEVDGLPGVAVAGELDAATCDRLARALDRASKRREPVVLDLGACTFMDSSGLGTIVRAARSKLGRGGLVICNARGFVAILLHASGLFATEGVYRGLQDGTHIDGTGERVQRRRGFAGAGANSRPRIPRQPRWRALRLSRGRSTGRGKP
jgi:anti-anti-sigma factor